MAGEGRQCPARCACAILCYTVGSGRIGEESCSSGEETMPTTCAVLAPDDRRVVHELLADVGACASVGQRLRLITARLLGAPYLAHPLVGSATEPEVFTVTLQGFDCVTLVETALALAWADDSEAFLTLLRQVRYRHGEIAWQQRLHYATDWLHHHVQHGRLSEVACGEAMQRITRRLDVLPGLPPIPPPGGISPQRHCRPSARVWSTGISSFLSRCVRDWMSFTSACSFAPHKASGSVMRRAAVGR